MRSPRCFMRSSSWHVTGFRWSATGGLRPGRDGRVELSQFSLPEVALREAGMRNGQLRLPHDAVAVPDDIQVERARTPPDTPFSPALGFDGMEVIEQRRRLECRLEQDHLVQVGALRHRPEGGGLLDAGCLEQATL